MHVPTPLFVGLVALCTYLIVRDDLGPVIRKVYDKHRKRMFVDITGLYKRKAFKDEKINV